MSQDKQKPSRLIFKPAPSVSSEELRAAKEEERLRVAREKAAQYSDPKTPETNQDEEDKPQTLEEWADLVTKRIEEAMRRGDFNNLPGHGKPMPAEQEAFVPEDQRMAFKLLKNNDMTPTWIGDRKETLRTIEVWREEFQRVVNQAHSAWVAAGTDERRVQIRQSWERWLVRWEDEIVEINRKINLINLKQPITHLEIFKLRLDDELRKVGMARTLEK